MIRMTGIDRLKGEEDTLHRDETTEEGDLHRLGAQGTTGDLHLRIGIEARTIIEVTTVIENRAVGTERDRGHPQSRTLWAQI